MWLICDIWLHKSLVFALIYEQFCFWFKMKIALTFASTFTHSANNIEILGGRTRLPKFKFSVNFTLGLHVILQLQIKQF